MATKVKVKLLSEKAVLPSRAHKTDTGYDLKFTEVHKVSGDVIFFRTGISLQPSKGYYFEVVPRSSISKLPLSMANSIGIIDESYTGEIIIPVRVHHGQMGFSPKSTSYPNGLVEAFGVRPQTMLSLAGLILEKKPCLFQAILRKRLSCDFQLEELDNTDRGDGGFGSTDGK
tara:strand:+ start:174 stop:689 length:516 start_codon:yes stop_codon:yes gene_type:complete